MMMPPRIILRREVFCLLVLAALANAVSSVEHEQTNPKFSALSVSTNAKLGAHSKRDVNLEGMFDSWEGHSHDWGRTQGWSFHKRHHHHGHQNRGFLHDPVEEEGVVDKWEGKVAAAFAAIGLSETAEDDAEKPRSLSGLLSFVRTGLSANCSALLSQGLLGQDEEMSSMPSSKELIKRCMKEDLGGKCKSEAEITARKSKSAALKVRGSGCLPKACAQNEADMQALVGFLREESEAAVDGGADVRVNVNCKESGGKDASAPSSAAGPQAAISTLLISLSFLGLARFF